MLVKYIYNTSKEHNYQATSCQKQNQRTIKKEKEKKNSIPN